VHGGQRGEKLETALRSGFVDPPASTLAANAKLSPLLYGPLNGGGRERAVELFRAGSTIVDMPSGQRFLGEAGVARFLAGWSSAFDDGSMDVVRVVPSAEGATVEFVFHGRQTGPLETMAGRVAPTGSLVELNGCDVMEIQGDHILRLHSYYDAATLLVQLGVAGSEKEPAGTKN